MGEGSKIEEKVIKFGLSEKHTNFEKNLSHGFDVYSVNQLICQNHEEDFFSNFVCFSESPNFKDINSGMLFKSICFDFFSTYVGSSVIGTLTLDVITL